MKRMIQTQIELDSQKLETTTDVKFQNIIYYYWDGKKSVDQNQQVKIDFLGAVSEMEKLDYKFEKNFIGFQNLYNLLVILWINLLQKLMIKKSVIRKIWNLFGDHLKNKYQFG